MEESGFLTELFLFDLKSLIKEGRLSEPSVNRFLMDDDPDSLFAYIHKGRKLSKLRIEKETEEVEQITQQISQELIEKKWPTVFVQDKCQGRSRKEAINEIQKEAEIINFYSLTEEVNQAFKKYYEAITKY